MKKIEKRYWEYAGHDCYAFVTVCTCGESVVGWTEGQANEKWDDHKCKTKIKKA